MTGVAQQLPMQQGSSEKIDVAINIFAKPYQSALCSVVAQDSGNHVGTIWLQFEPSIAAILCSGAPEGHFCKAVWPWLCRYF